MGVGPGAAPHVAEVLMVGCGSIGQAVLPLLVRDMHVAPERITVVTADGRGRDMAEALGATFIMAPLHRRELPRRARARSFGRADSC